MKDVLYKSLLILLCINLSCEKEGHFISDPAYRKEVRYHLKKQQELAIHRSDTLFGVFRQSLSTQEHEALEFLYAYSPLNDLADYSGQFFLQNVRSTLAARDTFSWGRTIPEEIFRHFVLPVRVNNENLDSSRWVFFSELKDRIKGMSMKDATLEVNHWCHEKVTYRSSDSRTSSPIATVRTAFGRCGEESTFTTAALRAVCIPARQCYTPRWAHGDDNHAWVEVWIDSAWHYLGACEPEPVLDRAWFTAPAKRAMLVSTNVFGNYTGPEDVLMKDDRFTRINILPNYTETKRIWARTMDIHQRPVPYSEIEFQIYNYAEFFPLHKTRTDNNGLASFLTGYGDLLIWASKGGFFGFTRADVRTSDTVNIFLELTPSVSGGINFDFTPPIQQDYQDETDESLLRTNNERIGFEDELRAAYETTFVDSAKAFRIASTLDLKSEELWYFLQRARGNWREIIRFASEVPDTLRRYIFPLLGTISEKDLRDITPDVLLDAIKITTPNIGLSGSREHVCDTGVAAGNERNNLFVNYIMNPRIDNELLKPFHSFLLAGFQSRLKIGKEANPDAIADWIKSSIAIDSMANYSRAPLTPRGVYELRVSDPHSRDIFFVAACRSMGIPARLEPATKIPQYHFAGKWTDVHFGMSPAGSERNATMVIKNVPENNVNPEYSIHYTVGQHSGGFFKTLDYENNEVTGRFPVTLSLIPNTYMVVSGTRLSDGTVLARIFFTGLEPGKTAEIPLILREDFTPPPVFGSFMQSKLQADLKKKGIQVDPGLGLVMAWIDPGAEPTRHFLGDLKKKANVIGKWKGSIILFVKDRSALDNLISSDKSFLPGNTLFATFDAYPFSLLYYSLDLPLSGKLPVVLFINPSGIINFFSEGYRIGTGEELTKNMNRNDNKQE